jgi:hypothetical protein
MNRTFYFVSKGCFHRLPSRNTETPEQFKYLPQALQMPTDIIKLSYEKPKHSSQSIPTLSRLARLEQSIPFSITFVYLKPHPCEISGVISLVCHLENTITIRQHLRTTERFATDRKKRSKTRPAQSSTHHHATQKPKPAHAIRSPFFTTQLQPHIPPSKNSPKLTQPHSSTHHNTLLRHTTTKPNSQNHHPLQLPKTTRLINHTEQPNFNTQTQNPVIPLHNHSNKP